MWEKLATEKREKERGGKDLNAGEGTHRITKKGNHGEEEEEDKEEG